MNHDTVVIDSSVCVAIFKGEPENTRLAERAFAYKRRVMSAASWLEAAIICQSAVREGGAAHFERIVSLLDIEVVPVTAQQVRFALEAFKRFGKGRGVPASLNYGDCFVYALARQAAGFRPSGVYWAITIRGNWRIIFRFADETASAVELIDYH